MADLTSSSANANVDNSNLMDEVEMLRVNIEIYLCKNKNNECY